MEVRMARVYNLIADEVVGELATRACRDARHEEQTRVRKFVQENQASQVAASAQRILRVATLKLLLASLATRANAIARQVSRMECSGGGVCVCVCCLWRFCVFHDGNMLFTRQRLWQQDACTRLMKGMMLRHLLARMKQLATVQKVRCGGCLCFCGVVLLCPCPVLSCAVLSCPVLSCPVPLCGSAWVVPHPKTALLL